MRKTFGDVSVCIIFEDLGEIWGKNKKWAGKRKMGNVVSNHTNKLYLAVVLKLKL